MTNFYSKFILPILILTLAFTFTACGGGGGDDDNQSAPVIQYIITGSAPSSFSVEKDGVTIGTGTINDVISAIKTDAAGEDCTIQFGNGTSELNIGSSATSYVGFDGTGWGTITLSGKITSGINDSARGTIYINGVSINVKADIKNTANNGNAVYNASSSSGNVNIISGIVSATGSGYAVYNASAITVNISNSAVIAGSIYGPKAGQTVYVAGHYNDKEACYWKDGVRTNLIVPAGVNYFKARSICASGSNVYVAGDDDDEADKACYWVNGAKTDLTLSAGGSYPKARSIYLSGGDVYVAGNYEVGSWPSIDKKVCYWKNGVRTDLTPPAGGWTFIQSIFISFVSGINVYVSGDNDLDEACYWVNGTRTNLTIPAGSNYPHARSICASGGNVYVAGSYKDSSNNIACYWKNGIRTDLTPPAGGWPHSRSIYVLGGDVYVAGDDDGDNNKACYWVNGTRTDLSVPAGGSDLHVRSIYASGGNVYVAGSYDISGSSKACYWKNGTRIDLNIPAGSWAYAESIFVTE